MHRINISENGISIDGTSIRGVTEMNINMTPTSIPEISMTILSSEFDADLMAQLNIIPEVGSIQDAIRCISMFMRLDDEFRRAVILSAKSAIDEMRRKNQADVVNDYALADMIVERIFIGER